MEIDLKGCKRIGVKISGGADSAILTYLICKTIVEKNLDVEYIQPITTNNGTKPFNFYYSNQVLDWIKEQFPSIEFKAQKTNSSTDNDDYVKTQIEITERLARAKEVDCFLGGINLVPQSDDFSSPHDGPYEERTPENMASKISYVSNNVLRMNPFGLMDKKGIAKLYEENDLLETLFPLTRSCEGWAENSGHFRYHCDDCWHCHERKWAFGRLE